MNNMKTSLIEQLNDSRYNLIKWLTIGWSIWVGTYIAKDLIQYQLILTALVWVGLFGWIVFIINLLKYMKLKREVKSDSLLGEALNDELIQLNRYKSFFLGFWVTISIIGIFFGISLFVNITALMVCRTTIYVGVLSVLIAWLIYNNN
jgi:hypothetical protein